MRSHAGSIRHSTTVAPVLVHAWPIFISAWEIYKLTKQLLVRLNIERFGVRRPILNLRELESPSRNTRFSRVWAVPELTAARAGLYVHSYGAPVPHTRIGGEVRIPGRGFQETVEHVHRAV